MNFSKYQATGNDFIIVDDRVNSLDVGAKTFWSRLCQRRTGIGADGVIFLRPPQQEGTDFHMIYLNADGAPASMCGNGTRAITHFAHSLKIKHVDDINVKTTYSFTTQNSLYHSSIVDNKMVKVQMTEKSELEENTLLLPDGTSLPYHFINTGVPHCLVSIKNLKNFNVRELGEKIRFHKNFAPEGTNVNFYEINPDHSVYIRTYERGVENETLSCGTGITATAIKIFKDELANSPIVFWSHGGTLKVYLNSDLSEVFLEGEVKAIYEGQLNSSFFTPKV